jgi:hypothetical protein
MNKAKLKKEINQFLILSQHHIHDPDLVEEIIKIVENYNKNNFSNGKEIFLENQNPKFLKGGY